MTLHVVRHAKAHGRSKHEGPDQLRPLDDKGERQAKVLSELALFDRVTRVVSSPAVRCVDTVTPLAARLGVHVEVDDRLWEGHDATVVLQLAEELDAEDTDVVLCSHGDIIPDALHLLVMRGAELVGPNMVEKASTWSVTFEQGRPVTATHTAAPS